MSRVYQRIKASLLSRIDSGPTDFLWLDYRNNRYYTQQTGFTSFDAIHDFSRATGATRNIPTGLEEIGVDAPMLDWDAARGEYALRMQGQRTTLNDVPRVNLSSGWVPVSATLTGLNLSALGLFDGVSVASTGADWNRIRTNDFSVTSDSPVAVTAYYRAGTSGKARIVMRDLIGARESNLSGDAGSLSISSEDAGTISSLSEYLMPDGLTYEVKFVWTPNFSGSTNAGIGPFSTVAGENVIALAMQLENGGTQTSIIPDGGTRSPDLCSIDLAGLGLDLSGGYTVVVDCVLDGVEGDFDRVFQLDTGSGADRHTLFYNKSGSLFRAAGVADDVTQAFSDVGVSSATRNRFALRFANDDTAFAANGAVFGTDTTCTYNFPTALKLAASVAAVDKPSSVRYSEIRILPPQTNAQLEELSAL